MENYLKYFLIFNNKIKYILYFLFKKCIINNNERKNRRNYKYAW